MDNLDELVAEIVVDAYGDSEELTAFETAFATSARFPFPARIVGTEVQVVQVCFEGDERRGLTAVCRRGGERHRVALADLTPGPVTAETSLLLSAYRRWLGLPAPAIPPAVPSSSPARQPWVYRKLASHAEVLDAPLALRPMGTWDPAEQYWGEEDDEGLDPLIQEIIAAGPRPEYEMEQVIPGVDDEDWDTDPVADAAAMHRAGYDRESVRILEGLIVEDERCIDAWVHLGNIAFDSRGPKAAVELYDTAVAIGEASLLDGFNGVLPWGLMDNRPFLRALHGLGLCAWRQRRWAAAAQIFTARAWIDGGGVWDSVVCLHNVQAHRRWTSE